MEKEKDAEFTKKSMSRFSHPTLKQQIILGIIIAILAVIFLYIILPGIKFPSYVFVRFG